MLLISVDTLRADHLSCYGYSRPTPHLDALAGQGWRYTDAHATAPWTLPSHLSLLTGRFPSSHGVQDDHEVLSERVELLAPALQRMGYRTAGFVSHVYLDADYGFSRGFEEYELIQYENQPGVQAVRGDAVVSRAQAWWDGGDPSKQPLFLFVHLFDPHWNYAAPRPFHGRYSAGYLGALDGELRSMVPYFGRPLAEADLQHLIDLYDEEIAWTDALVGRLVQHVRSHAGGRRLIILLTSDHGEEFKEHGTLGHGLSLYREVTHVPLILWDSSQSGEVVGDRVQLVDVAPTLCDLTGVPLEDPFREGLEGTVLPGIEATDGPQRTLILETTRGGPHRSAVVVDDRKAISPLEAVMFVNMGRQGRQAVARFTRRTELYDVVSDPTESRTLEGDDDSGAVQVLERWMEQSWRGILLELRVRPGFEASFTLPEGTEWWDEVRLDDGEQILPIPDLTEHVVPLKNQPPERRLRLLIPVQPAEVNVLKVTVQSGTLSLLVHDSWETVTASSALTIDLSRPGSSRRFDPLPPVDRTVGQIRWRAMDDHGGTLVHDEERLKLLEGLGYAR